MKILPFYRSVQSPRTRGALARWGPAIGLLASAFVAGSAHAAIVTNQYTTTVFSFGAPDPDGAFHPLGTSVQVSIKFDNALTYIGGPDSLTHTLVTIPAGLTVTVGSDVFTADTYDIDFYNSGPGRANATIGFLTTDFSTLFPVLHNGSPYGAGNPGYMQFYFGNSGNTFTALPSVPGLSFPFPQWGAEGLVRETFSDDSHSYFFPNGTWSEVPSPAGGLAFAALLLVRRRRS